MPLTLTLPGLPTAPSTEFPDNAGLMLTTRQKWTLSARRDQLLTEQTLSVEPDDAVCLRLADGFEWWLRADEAAQLLRNERRVMAMPGGEILLDPTAALRAAAAHHARITGGDGQRSGDLSTLVVESLEVVGIDLAGLSAAKIGELAENQTLHANGPGLYHVDLLAAQMTLSKVESSARITSGPLLVFIHGTGSSSTGSFAELWGESNENDQTLHRENLAGKKARQQLAAHYGEQVYAFEHRTLTESPIDNALALARLLPEGAEVHLVTHSRGGLVGDLLCLGRRESSALSDKTLDELFAEDRTLAECWGWEKREAKGYPAQRQAITDLLAELDKKQLQIKRYVRTACPALGTTLASGRLDRWLSVLRFAGGTPMANGLLAFLLAVIKERTDPRSLPGLEAMMPGAALIRLLNLDNLRVDADLSVIAGHIQGDSLWKRITLALPALFFGDEHDLVVNTGSMYGGLRRTGGARYFFDHGPTVCHFNYFRNPKTIEQMEAGLIDPNGASARFTPIEASLRKQPARTMPKSRQSSGSQPMAIVIPGIMGSHLSKSEERVWFNMWRMANGGIEQLGVDQSGIHADGVFDRLYGDFIDFLQNTHTVKVFAYDWRLSIQESAKALAKLIEENLDHLERKHLGLHIIAHSMGGLVARAMLAQRPDLLSRLRKLSEPGAFRLMMLGTPNHGAYQAVRLMVGQHRLAKQLALLDFRHSSNDLLKIINRYPGAAELLPWAERDPNFADPQLWQALHVQDGQRWPLPAAEVLRTAQQSWALLRNAPADGSYMLYVAGWAGRTACDYQFETSSNLLGKPETRLVFLSTGRGDGTVSWDHGCLAGVPTWYAEGLEHDQLLADSRIFPAYLDLLLTGHTDRLSDSEPAAMRGLSAADDRLPMPEETAENYPTSDDFGGFGGTPPHAFWLAQPPALPQVRVSITHGDLAYARHPVCVGHYQGDTQVSAERRLDVTLKGALTDRLRLDIYPGRLGTWEIFIAPNEFAKPGGALVIGLGQVGQLTPGALSTAISRALLDYALQVANWHNDRFGAAACIRKARISSLLIGTGAGGFSVRDSVTAILQAVAEANTRLAQLPQSARVCIDELELLEVYEDIAIQAAHALGDALKSAELGQGFSWPEQEVKRGESGLQRGVFSEAPGWWRRLQIVHEQKRDQLHFVMLTDRARAEHSLATGQIRLADEFIAKITTSTNSDGELSRTLYEMLLPNPLKELAPERRDTILLVDEESARFPWEMLDDRWTDSGPLAISAGMLRQFITHEYRAKPTQTQASTALVIGNPQAGPGTELPGANDEAKNVVTTLRAHGYRVHSVISGGSGQIMRGLHADAYRILHLAGHGVLDHQINSDTRTKACDECRQPVVPTVQLRTGMLIGPNEVLTPGDIEQIRWVPELVFINCCHLGKTTNDGANPDIRKNHYGKLAANLAVQFIQMGVKAVIAAGWAVDDTAARTFAITFYEAMMRGQSFGRAVQEARQHTYRTHPHCNTWGAYQCYGDPDYRLVPDGNGKDENNSPYYSPQELVTELSNLASCANIDEIDGDRIERTLARVRPELKDDWLKRGDVGTALGLTWGQLGEFDKAIEWLDKAIQVEKSTIPLRALEQRANYKARQAAKLALGGKNDEAIALFEQAKCELDILLKVAPSIERHSLLGSYWKRRAASLTEGPLDALRSMQDSYQEADNLGKQQYGRDRDAYPKINCLLAELLISKLTASADYKEQMERISLASRAIASESHQRNQRTPKFWTAVAEPDALFVAALAEGKLAKEKEELLKLYRHAIERGASYREAASVKDQYTFVICLLGNCPESNDTVKLLREILDELNRMSTEPR